MKTQWDYTELADAYLKRPEYAADALDKMLATAGTGAGARVCDIGAGTGHLTIQLARRGLKVTALEPNDAMRSHGIEQTRGMEVEWHEATGEQTGRPDDTFELVTFGSSFNVTDRPTALRESSRILRSGGWFACMWNHRDLDDELQRAVEDLIRVRIPDYGYGTRREDQTAVIEESGLFGPVVTVEGSIRHSVPAGDWVEAWRSHATLQRQAGNKFEEIVNAIEQLCAARADKTIVVPYTTRIWMARVKK